MVNDNDPNWSKARLMHRQGEIRDFSTLGLTRAQQWELIRLLLKRKEDLAAAAFEHTLDYLLAMLDEAAEATTPEERVGRF
ncbi:hypothetical protein LTR94_037074, partial [Friedmanniomyces endolithicus]